MRGLTLTLLGKYIKYVSRKTLIHFIQWITRLIQWELKLLLNQPRLMYLFYDKRLEIKIDCIIKKVLTKDLFSGNIIKVVSGKRLRQAINEILQKEFQKHVDNNQSVVLI